MSDEYNFFSLRRAAKTYVSKVFTYGGHHTERLRNVRMVLEGSDVLHLGEVEGALCLRMSGEKRKTGVLAVVTQDDKAVRRVTLQSFQSRKGDWYQSFDEHVFTFRREELQRMLAFLDQIEFVDLSNEDRFDIEDISTDFGRKTIIDSTDRSIVERIREMNGEDRESLLDGMRRSLSAREINILLGRRDSLEMFETQFGARTWSEREWQDFFDCEPWVFGYGLDYRVMRTFDREMTVSGGGTDNRGRPVVDFLIHLRTTPRSWRLSDQTRRFSGLEAVAWAVVRAHTRSARNLQGQFLKFWSRRRNGLSSQVAAITLVVTALNWRLERAARRAYL